SAFFRPLRVALHPDKTRIVEFGRYRCKSIATWAQVGRNVGSSMPNLQERRTALQRGATGRHVSGTEVENNGTLNCRAAGAVFQKQESQVCRSTRRWRLGGEAAKFGKTSRSSRVF